MSISGSCLLPRSPIVTISRYMRWVEQGCWRNLADFGTPAIAFGDGVCFVASEGDKVVFWSPTAPRYVVPVDERPVVLCKGPENSVLAVASRNSWLLENGSPSANYTFSRELAPRALDNSVYAFSQGLFWYLIRELAGSSLGLRPEPRQPSFVWRSTSVGCRARSSSTPTAIGCFASALSAKFRLGS